MVMTKKRRRNERGFTERVSRSNGVTSFARSARLSAGSSGPSLPASSSGICPHALLHQPGNLACGVGWRVHRHRRAYRPEIVLYVTFVASRVTHPWRQCLQAESRSASCECLAGTGRRKAARAVEYERAAAVPLGRLPGDDLGGFGASTQSPRRTSSPAAKPDQQAMRSALVRAVRVATHVGVTFCAISA